MLYFILSAVFLLLRGNMLWRSLLPPRFHTIHCQFRLPQHRGRLASHSTAICLGLVRCRKKASFVSLFVGLYFRTVRIIERNADGLPPSVGQSHKALSLPHLIPFH